MDCYRDLIYFSTKLAEHWFATRGFYNPSNCLVDLIDLVETHCRQFASSQPLVNTQQSNWENPLLRNALLVIAKPKAI